MYLPAHFAETRPEALHAAMSAHPLATLVSMSGRGLEANPIPLLLKPDTGNLGELWGHVARANPLWREHPADVEVLAVFQGAQSYVSPNWYPTKQEQHKVVPTWNYVTVQARGKLRVMDDAAWVLDLVSTLTATHEATQPRPWSVADAPPDYIAAMLKAIVGIRIEITELSGKWKVSQNQPQINREGVVSALAARSDDMARAMAAAVAAGTGRTL